MWLKYCSNPCSGAPDTAEKTPLGLSVTRGVRCVVLPRRPGRGGIFPSPAFPSHAPCHAIFFFCSPYLHSSVQVLSVLVTNPGAAQHASLCLPVLVPPHFSPKIRVHQFLWTPCYRVPPCAVSMLLSLPDALRSFSRMGAVSVRPAVAGRTSRCTAGV